MAWRKLALRDLGHLPGYVFGAGADLAAEGPRLAATSREPRVCSCRNIHGVGAFPGRETAARVCIHWVDVRHMVATRAEGVDGVPHAGGDYCHRNRHPGLYAGFARDQ